VTATAVAPPAVGDRLRRWGPWAALALVLVVLAVLGGAPRHEGNPLDPDGTGSGGAKAARLLAESYGADVHVISTAPGRTDTVALLLEDAVDDDQVAVLERWVQAGGTLVVADPQSRFTPEAVAGGALGAVIDGGIPRGDCAIAELTGLARLTPGFGAARYRVQDGSTGCFTDDSGDAFVVRTPRGRGAVIAVGGTGPFTNDLLDDTDNAALVADLLAPAESTRVAWLVAGSGHRTTGLADAIAPGVRLAFAQLFVAFLVYAWFRARRLGSPVVESQPVPIEGSELVAAVGRLQQQRRVPDESARLLRADLRRRLADRLGVVPHTPAPVLADAVAARTGVDRDRLLAVLDDRPITTDAELVAFAAALDAIRTEVLHGPTP